MSNLSHTASPPSQLLIVPPPAPVTVQPVGFDVVKRKKRQENLPGVSKRRFFPDKVVRSGYSGNKRVVLYPHVITVIIVSNVNLLWFPSTNIFVVTRNTDFLAEHNVMSCGGGDLTFHFEHKTSCVTSLWNMNLIDNLLSIVSRKDSDALNNLTKVGVTWEEMLFVLISSSVST